MAPKQRQYSVSSGSSHHSVGSSSVFSSSAMSMSSMSTVETGPHFQAPQGDFLPCEFVGYSNCEQRFALNEVDLWIEHIISDHLQGSLPDKVICWFCDDYIFDSNRVGNRHLNFQQRMWHIRDHFWDGGVGVHNMRPDYYFNEHLRRSRLIPDHVYHSVRRYTEVPQPNWIIPHDEELPSRQPGGSRNEYEYSNPHDEERHYRRHRHRHGKSRK
ncbi:hypothetical protein F5Y10DRAFT_6087 [Nemania abortiva]|nr:hypothetical protein F5Y10DRAFT_6087 [Nemania abortiva]